MSYKINAYKEVLATLNKHEGILKTDGYIDIRSYLQCRILWTEISDKSGIEIDVCSCNNTGYFKLSAHQFIAIYGEKHNRTISWPDDSIQPEDEWLYVISFPTGAYIFDREYPQKTFQSFFNELKSHGAKYIDSANHNLYYSLDNAKQVHNNFKTIFAKYKALVDDELKLRRIEEIKAELNKLETSK